MTPTPAEELRARLGGAGAVDLRETHGAWVLLDGDRALKIKKPVRMAFLDYSTPAKRLQACRDEVAVNAALAPGLYRGVRALVREDGRLRLEPSADVADAVDYAVEMRRFNEGATLAARLRAGEVAPGDLARVAERIADFHAAAAVCSREGARPFIARVGTDLRELAAFGAADAAAEGFAAGVERRFGAFLDARARAGLRRDVHGDLRAEHVVLEGGEVMIVDRLEFDAALRCCDVAHDIAFLMMDLEALGHAGAADELLAAYRRAGGDPGPAPLLAVFAWQRALIRAKVALIAGRRDEAAALLALAERLAWRARTPPLVLVTGPPASGKSALAAALRERTGARVLSSDVVRKDLLGLERSARAPARAYGDDVTRRVYRTLRERAHEELEAGRPVVVDATARTAALRSLLLEGAPAPHLVVVCDAPADVLAQRARARERDGHSVSDAGPEVARRLAATFEQPVPGPGVVRLDATRELADMLGELARRLDADAPQVNA